MSEIEINSGGVPSDYGLGTITGVISSDGLSGSAYTGVAVLAIDHDYSNIFSVEQSVVVSPSISGLDAFSAIALGADAKALHAETYASDSTSLNSISTYGLPANLVSMGSSYTISGGSPTTTPIVSEILRLSKAPYDATAIGTGLSQNFYISSSGFVSTYAGGINVVLTDPLDASFGSSLSLLTSSSAIMVESLKLQGVYASFLSGAYLNFGSVSGGYGYGIRDFGGKIQFRHSTGLWSDMGSVGGSSSAYSYLHYSIDGKFCNIEFDGNVSGVFANQRLFAASPTYGFGIISMRTISDQDLPVIPISGGGTGNITADGALLALLPVHTVDDANKILSLDDTATYVVWADAAGTGISHSSLSNLSFSASGHLGSTSAVANTFIAGPISGANAAPSFRIISVNDIPILTDDKLPIVPIWKGGTGSVTSEGAMLEILPSIIGNDNKTLKIVEGKVQWVDSGILSVESGGTGSNTPMGALLGLLPYPLIDNAVLTVNGSSVEWGSAEAGAEHSGLTNLSLNSDDSGHFSASTDTVANTFIAGPTSGDNGLPSFRRIVSDDLLGVPISANDLPIIEIIKGGTGSNNAQSAITSLLPSQVNASGLYLKSDGTFASWAAMGSSFVDLTTVQSISGLKTFTSLSSFNSNVAIKSSTTPFPYMTLAFSGTATTTYTFPVPTAGGFLTTNASGVLSWGTPTIALADLPVVSILKGGTGQTTAQLARNALLPAQSGNSGRFLTSNGTDVSWSAVSGFVDLTTAQTIAGLKTFTNFQLKNATNFVDNFYTSDFTAQNHVYGLPVNVHKPGTGSTFVLGYLESNCNPTWNGSVWTDTTTLDWIDIGTNYFTLGVNSVLRVSNIANSFAVGYDPTYHTVNYHPNVNIGKLNVYCDTSTPLTGINVINNSAKTVYSGVISLFSAVGIMSSTTMSSTYGDAVNSDYKHSSAAVIGDGARGALGAAFRTVRPLPFHYNSSVVDYESNPLDKRYINDYDGTALFLERMGEDQGTTADTTWTTGIGSLSYASRSFDEVNGYGVSTDFYALGMTGVTTSVNHGWPDARMKMALNISGNVDIYGNPLHDGIFYKYPTFEFYLYPESIKHSNLTFKPWPIMTLSHSPISSNIAIDPIPVFTSTIQGKSIYGNRIVNINTDVGSETGGALHVVKYTNTSLVPTQANVLWACAYNHSIAGSLVGSTQNQSGFGVSQVYASGEFSSSLNGLGEDLGVPVQLAHTIAQYITYPSWASFNIHTRSRGVVRATLTVKLDNVTSNITEISQHDAYDAAITMKGTGSSQETKINRLVIGAGEGADTPIAGRLWIEASTHRLWYRDHHGDAHMVNST